MDILQQLFSKNANEILQNILLCLDRKTLHEARTVSKKWNEIICDLVWNSKKGRAVLKERRILKWKKDPTKVMSYDYSDQMIIYQNPWDAVAKSFDVDEKILVCGLSPEAGGGAKVIDVESRAIIATLDHQKGSGEEKKFPVTEVVLTKNWIVTTTETRVYAWRRDNYKLAKAIVIDRRGIVNINLSATESKNHLFITCNVFRDPHPTGGIYYIVHRISPIDNQVTVETIPKRSSYGDETTLTNGMLVVRQNPGLKSSLIVTTYNLEVSGLSMFKLSSEHDLDTFTCASQVRGCVSYPYFVHPEKDEDYYEDEFDEPIRTLNMEFVSIWNLDTGEMVMRLQFDLKRDGYLRGVMLKNDILAIRFKEFEYYGGGDVKFYIYDINNKDKDSESLSHSPINMIDRGREEAEETPDGLDAHTFRMNNFSIIEKIENSFVYIDFC